MSLASPASLNSRARVSAHIYTPRRTLFNSSTMYGGYDGSASQFAGQGGFTAGQTAAAGDADGGAVRALARDRTSLSSGCKDPSAALGGSR